MTDHSSRSLLRRTFGGAASALVMASILLTPATTLATGGPGTPPDLFPDVITTSEDAPVSGNVLTNDVNSSGVVPFTVTTYTQPGASVGTLVIASNGAYTFTPAPDFSGSGSATYFASNTKHEVGPAQITINVLNAQDPPTAGDDSVTVVEDTATDVKAAILANDSDPDGDTISVTGATNATGGSVSLAGGAVTFTPNADLCGDDAGSFDYDIAATGGTDSAHVTVDITCANDAPVAVDDDASGDEDTDVVIAEATLASNDTDVEGDTLSVIGVSNASGGSVSRAGGDVTFTPDADLCGDNAASFDYTVGDGNSGNDTGTVTIDLACAQDAPVAVDDSTSGTEDGDVTITASDLADNDTDVDGDTLTVTGVDNASGGTVSLVSGTITFTPNADNCGDASASFDYTVDDGNGGTDTGTVTIDLDCENDNPVANDDTATADEDTATDVTSSILGNDTDVDGDTLSVSDVSNATGGTVDLTDDVVTFTPDADVCGDGAGGFDYQVSDGNGGTDTGHVTVDVTCENDNPVAADDDASGTEDTDVVVSASGLAAQGSDVDAGDILTVTGASNASGGTVAIDGDDITFTPADDLCGDDVASFDYTLDDGNGGTDTGTVTIDLTCVNDNPVAADDDASGTEDTDVVVSASGLAAQGTDVDGSDTLTVTGVSNASGGTVELDGDDITFTPNADLCGDDVASFDYTLDDGNGGTDTGTVTIDLECENDAPIAVDDSKSGTEDTDVVFPAADLAGNDTDVDLDTLTVTAVSNASGGTVGLTTGTITFTPTANLCGDESASFDYTVDDGNDTDTGTVTIDLTCVNDAPVAVDDSASGTEDTNVVVTGATLASNDTDVDGDTRTVTAVSNPSGGSVDLTTGTVTFTPTANLCGDDAASFDYTVSDGHGGTDTGHVTIDLTCANDAPVAVNDTASVGAGSGAADHNVLANDSDVDGDTLSISSATVLPAQGSASVNGTKVSFTPAVGFSGTAVITYVISDGSLTDSATLTVTVVSDTTPPTVNPIAVHLGVARVDKTSAVTISWGATDAGSGVASYQVQVSIGGKPYQTISTGSATSIKKVYDFNRSFQIRVRATDTMGNTSGWKTAKYRMVAIQNIATGVKYTSPWTWVTSMASSGDGYSFATRAGSAASLRFYGEEIAYVAPKMANGGFVKVFLDGHLVGRYSVRKATTALGQVIARTTASGGFHTIRVVNDQAGRRSTLDAFVILRKLS